MDSTMLTQMRKKNESDLYDFKTEINELNIQTLKSEYNEEIN